MFLKDNRVDPTCEDNDAICKASINCKGKAITILLEDDRVDPSVSNNLVLENCMMFKDYHNIKLLLKNHKVRSTIDISSYGFTDQRLFKKILAEIREENIDEILNIQ